MGKNTVADRERRHQALVDFVSERGTTTPEQLAEALNVSLMTIYRDISALELSGLVRRDRGAIMLAPYTLAEASALMRAGTQISAKKRLAQAVMRYLSSGISVALDDSTTLIHLFPHLAELDPLTVITNSRLISEEVINNSRLELLQLGGSFVRWADAYSGPSAISMMKGLRPDVCVMSTTAISEGQLAHPDAAMAALKAQMLESSRKRILVVDKTKFAKSALYRFFPLEKIDVVITEAGISNTLRETLTDSVAEVVLV